MKVARFFAVLFLLLFVCFSPSILFAYDSSKEYISEFTPDTGNMNERPADRNFAGSFIVKTKSTNVNDYKVDGVAKKINVAVYVSWQNNGSFSRVYTSSYTPVSGSSVISSKTINFTCSNPETWSKPIRVIIVAQYNATPTDSPQTSYSGRGHIIDQLVETPTPLANVSLGSGSTAFEGLKSFTGSTGEVDPVTGKVKLLMTVLVTIFQNPLGGSYDPTPEGIGVFADLTGGSNPTTRVYGETKLAGAYWDSIGRPSLPFDLPFYGEWLIDNDNYPGEIVGGTAMAWGAVPVLGSNTTWGQQNRVVWYLPPKKVVFQVKENLVPNWKEVNGEKIYEIYDGQSFGASASVLLRTMQIPSRVGGFEWNWGNGTATDTSHKIAGKLHSDKTYQYNLPSNDNTTDHIYTGYCNVHYQNSKNNSSDLRYPFKVKVKPLPAINAPTSISVKRIEGPSAGTLGNDSWAILREDISYSFTGTGKKRLVTTEQHKNTYSYYYTITDYVDSSTTPTTLTKNPTNSHLANAPYITHKFIKAAEGNSSNYSPHRMVKLYITYHKGAMVNGEIKDLGVTTELLASREFILGVQDVEDFAKEQCIRFEVTPASSPITINTTNTFTNYPYKPDYNGYKCVVATITPTVQTVAMKFKATSHIFYGGKFENSKNDLNDSIKTDLDRFNGVKPGTVFYRWRVLTANDEDAIEKGYVTVPSNQYYLVRDFIATPTPLLNTSNSTKYKIIGTDRKSYNSVNDMPSGVSPLTKYNDTEKTDEYVYETDCPTGISDITLIFNTPYGTTVNPNRYYKVFIEAKYQDIKWSANYYHSSGFADEAAVTGSKDSGKQRWSIPTPQQRYIAYTPVNIFSNSTKYQKTSTLSMTSSYGISNDNDFKFFRNSTDTLNEILQTKENSDVLYDGSIGYLVKINDEIPAKVELKPLENIIENPSWGNKSFEAYAGDPLKSQPATYTVKVKVTDNNPDLIASYVEIIYDRFDEAKYNVQEKISAVNDLASPADYQNKFVSRANGNFTKENYSNENIAQEIFNSLKLKGKLTPTEKTEGYPFIVSSLKKYNSNKSSVSPYYSSYLAFYSDEYERLPESFATTMSFPKYHGYNQKALDVINGHPIATGTLYYKAKVYFDDGIKHYIETNTLSFSVIDNDIPNVKVTLVNPETGNSTVFELIEGFNDPHDYKKYPSEIIENTTLINKVRVGTGTPKLDYISEIYDKKGILTINQGNTFTATANERFVCNIEIKDNIFPPANNTAGYDKFTINAYTSKDNEDNQNTFTNIHPRLRFVTSEKNSNNQIVYNRAMSSNPIELFLTTVGNNTLTVDVIDNAQQSQKTIRIVIPITVQKQKDAVIRVLDQRHEK